MFYLCGESWVKPLPAKAATKWGTVWVAGMFTALASDFQQHKSIY